HSRGSLRIGVHSGARRRRASGTVGLARADLRGRDLKRPELVPCVLAAARDAAETGTGTGAYAIAAAPDSGTGPQSRAARAAGDLPGVFRRVLDDGTGSGTVYRAHVGWNHPRTPGSFRRPCVVADGVGVDRRRC